MSVYASTGAVRAPRDLWAVLDAYREAGITHVELGACALADDADLAARLLSRGFIYLVHNYFPPPHAEFVLNLASPDPALARRSLAFVHDALELSSELGAPLYSVHAGFVTDPAGSRGGHFVIPAPSSPAEAQAARERLAGALAEALDRARELGIRLAIENLDVLPGEAGRIVPATPAEFRSLLDDVAGLGLLLDTGHLSVAACTLGFAPEDFLDAVAGSVVAVHAHENDGSRDRHLPVSAGGWVLESLRRLELADAPVVVEAHFESASELAAHTSWLQEQLWR